MNQEQRLVGAFQAIGADIKNINTNVGPLASLTTEEAGSLVGAVNELVAAIAAARDSIGTLSSLNTTAKTNLVASINDIYSALSSINLTGLIDDTATSGVTDKVYSASKVISMINALKADIMGGIPPEVLDSFKEFADFLTDNTVAGGFMQQIGNRVRVDAAQTFTAEQQAQGRANLNAASVAAVNTAQSTADGAQSSVDALSLAIGDTDRNYVSVYTAAKA